MPRRLRGAWILVLIASVGVALGSLLGARSSTGHVRVILLGLATGVMYGLAAALFKTCSRQLTHPTALLSHWPVYVLVVVGALGVVLNQNVYQAGMLAPGLTALTLAEPITAVAIGTSAFGEHLQLSPSSIAAVVVAAWVIAAGLWFITTARPRPAPDRDGEAGWRPAS